MIGRMSHDEALPPGRAARAGDPRLRARALRLDASHLGEAARRNSRSCPSGTCRAVSRSSITEMLLQPDELRRQPAEQLRSSPRGAVLLGLGVPVCPPPTRSRASASRAADADDAVPRHQHVSDRPPDHPALRPDAEAGAPRHLPRRHPRPLHLLHPVRDLDAGELLQRDPAGPRRGGDHRRRIAPADDPPRRPAAGDAGGRDRGHLRLHHLLERIPFRHDAVRARPCAPSPSHCSCSSASSRSSGAC